MGEAAEEANRAAPEVIWAMPQQEWYINLFTPNQNTPSILNLLSLSISTVLKVLWRHCVIYWQLCLQEPMEGLVQKLVGQLHKRSCPHGC